VYVLMILLFGTLHYREYLFQSSWIALHLVTIPTNGHDYCASRCTLNVRRNLASVLFYEPYSTLTSLMDTELPPIDVCVAAGNGDLILRLTKRFTFDKVRCVVHDNFIRN
jgi:hypothetical protein